MDVSRHSMFNGLIFLQGCLSMRLKQDGDKGPLTYEENLKGKSSIGDKLVWVSVMQLCARKQTRQSLSLQEEVLSPCSSVLKNVSITVCVEIKERFQYSEKVRW